MEVAVGKFAATLTAQQVVSGLGMSSPPQLIWFYGSSMSSPTYAPTGVPSLRPSFGQAINGQTGGSVTTSSRDARGTSVEYRVNTSLNDWVICNANSSSIEASFIVSAYAADSFTIDWSPIPLAQYDIGYVAINGLTNIYRSAQLITAAGTSFLTGTQVDFAAVMTAANVALEGTGTDASFSFGATSDGTIGKCIGYGARGGQGTTDTGRVLAPGASFALRSGTVVRSRATWNGWSAASVDTNWSQFRSSQDAAFTGIEGGEWEVDSFGVVSGATQKITLPFAPKGVVLWANGVKTTDNQEAITLTYQVAYGITDGTTQYGVFGSNLDGVGDTECRFITDESHALVLYDPISTLATIEASVALDADGFTLTYDTVSAGVNDTEIIYVAFGDAGGPPATTLSGTALGESLVTGDLIFTPPAATLSGTALGESLVTGDLIFTPPTAGLSGTALGESITGAKLGVSVPMAGAAVGESIVSGNLTFTPPGASPLNGTALGESVVSGDLAVGAAPIGLAGVAIGESVASGLLFITTPMFAISLGESVVSASLSAAMPGVVLGAGTVEAKDWFVGIRAQEWVSSQ